MNAIEDVVGRLERLAGPPAPRTHRGACTPFPLRVLLVRGSAAASPTSAWPADLAWFWAHVAEARLYEDTTYGQWGLVLYSQSEAEAASVRFAAERSTEAIPGDVVVGEFLGDSDLLLVRCDAGAPDFGAVLVALPIDPRPLWPTVALTLASFLRQLADADGDKFWSEQG